MATIQIIAAKTQLAVERLQKAQTELQSLLGVEFEPQPVTNKDKDVARFQQLENVAGFIEAVTEAVKAKAESKADESKGEGKVESEAESGPESPQTLSMPSTPPVVSESPDVVERPKTQAATQPSKTLKQAVKPPAKRK